jgi:hypothetical protein
MLKCDSQFYGLFDSRYCLHRLDTGLEYAAA